MSTGLLSRRDSDARCRMQVVHKAPSSAFYWWRYAGGMTDEQFERYLEFCKRLFEKMRRENAWPWTDSPDFGDVVESKDSNDEDI
jgi:hypothetical protein